MSGSVAFYIFAHPKRKNPQNISTLFPLLLRERRFFVGGVAPNKEI